MGQEVRTKKSNTSGVNAVLIGNDFPELGADLVAALAALDVNNLTHVTGGGGRNSQARMSAKHGENGRRPNDGDTDGHAKGQTRGEVGWGTGQHVVGKRHVRFFVL